MATQADNMIVANRTPVLFFVPHSGKSGAESNIENLLLALPKEEFDIHLVAPAAQPLLKTVQAAGGTPYARVFPRFASTSFETARIRFFNPFATVYNLILVLRLSFWLTSYARQHHIRIIYTGAMMAHLIGLLARTWNPEVRLIIHMQNIISPHLLRGAGRAVFNRFVRRATCIVAISQAVADSLPDSDKVLLVRNGVESSLYENAQASTLRTEFDIPTETVLIGVVGRLTPWKGQQLFLDAAARLIERNTKIHFVIVGDDLDPVTGASHYRQFLEDHAGTLKIEKHVLFTGFRQNIPNIMLGLDILVVPSIRPDPFALVTAEGMAARLPVVGSRAGGIAEIILDGVTGRLFPPGNAEALAACLQELIDDPALRTQYGNAGRQRVQEYFTLERYTHEFTMIFRRYAR